MKDKAVQIRIGIVKDGDYEGMIYVDRVRINGVVETLSVENDINGVLRYISNNVELINIINKKKL